MVEYFYIQWNSHLQILAILFLLTFVETICDVLSHYTFGKVGWCVALRTAAARGSLAGV